MNKVVGWVLIILLPCLAGCWDAREISNLAIVVATAIEEADQPGYVKLTYQIVIPGKLGGPEAGAAGAEQPPVRVGSSTGKTEFEAVRNFVTSGSRRLFWAHNQLFIIDERLARKGIKRHLDFLIRDPEPRPDVPIFIAKTPAGDILRAYDGVELIPAIGHVKVLSAASDNGFIPLITVQDFFEASHSKTRAAVAPMMEPYQENGFNNQKTTRVRLGGMAVFTQGRMVGTMGLREIHGYLWGLGKRSAGVIVVNYRGEPNTMEIIKSHSKITPVMQGGRLKVQIQVWVETNLGELQVEQPITPELLKVLKKRQNEVIRQELTATIMKSQAMKADILDLGGAVHARYPKVWRTLEPKWADYYSQLPVEVLVDSLVSDIGTTNHGHAGR